MKNYIYKQVEDRVPTILFLKEPAFKIAQQK